MCTYCAPGIHPQMQRQGWRLSYFQMCIRDSYWVTALTIAVLFAFGRSRHGRAIIAIREDDIASEASGIPNTYYKVLAFTISAFFAGVAGAVYAQQMQVLGAKTFNFMRSIDILVIVVLGGLGSLTGSIIAAAVSYTHLDVYKRQRLGWRSDFPG